MLYSDYLNMTTRGFLCYRMNLF